MLINAKTSKACSVRQGRVCNLATNSKRLTTIRPVVVETPTVSKLSQS